MIVLFGSASGPKLREYWGTRTNLGVLQAPDAWQTPWCTYACDNDVFANRADPSWWAREGEKNWLKMLDKIPSEQQPMWALLPDVVADWQRTLDRAWRYRREAISRALPYAIALQDGCRFEDVLPLQPYAVFVGGTTSWKWANAEPACQFFQPRGIHVHIGRASGPWRVRECLRIGADSCDGTGWGRFADKMLPGLWQVLDNTHPQQTLAL